ncbi:MAG: sulfate adenylyltransferase [Campylobacterales bacterium]|nr:sulfate adenylyltransferase [Campylobacterales bacterium]
MASSRKNRALYIDEQAISALGLLKAGLLYPVTELMNKAQMEVMCESRLVNGISFPFPFLLAPSGKVNEEVLTSVAVGETLDLVCNKERVGSIIIEEVFEIDPKRRLLTMYGTDDINHPGILSNFERIGRYAVSGPLQIRHEELLATKAQIAELKAATGANITNALVMAANPFHRAHERLIRQTLEKSDLLVIFLLKPYHNADLTFELRAKVLDYFIHHFLPKNRVIVVPLESSYIFGGYNEIILDAIIARNYGCNILTIGQNHAGVNLYYDRRLDQSLLEKMQGIDIQIDIASEYVYCNICTTLVSTHTCPHGRHHHISYASDSILKLYKLGILPPAVLVRKEISAIILSSLYPNRLEGIEKLYNDLMPHSGLLESHSERDFYVELTRLHQTTSLT